MIYTGYETLVFHTTTVVKTQGVRHLTNQLSLPCEYLGVHAGTTGLTGIVLGSLHKHSGQLSLPPGPHEQLRTVLHMNYGFRTVRSAHTTQPTHE